MNRFPFAPGRAGRAARRRPVRALSFALGLLGILIAGCAAIPERNGAPAHVNPGEPSPLHRTRETPPSGQPEQRPEGKGIVLDLDELMRLVEDCPALEEERENVARETGLILQKSYMPNPVLHLETEMMPLDDMGFGNARNKVGISQRIETAGKAHSRVALADARRKEAEAAYFDRRARIAASAAKDFYGILFLKEKVKCLSLRARSRERLLDLASEMNRRGRLSDRDFTAYEVAAGRADADLRKAEAERAELIGETEGLLGLPAGTIAGCRRSTASAKNPWTPPDYQRARESILRSNSGLVLLDRRLEAARAARDLEKSGAWPDVTVGLSYTRGAEDMLQRDDYVGAFLELPLPLIDRNKGGKLGAEADVRRAAAALEGAAAKALDMLEGLSRRYESLERMRSLYLEKIIPGLEKSLSLTKDSVAAGRLSPRDRFEAEVRVEEARAESFEIERELAAVRADMILLLGAGQV